jgi:hypothetical protein
MVIKIEKKTRDIIIMGVSGIVVKVSRLDKKLIHYYSAVYSSKVR